MSEENEPIDPDQENVNPVDETMEIVFGDRRRICRLRILEELSEVEQLHAQVADAEKRVLLAHAELENYRKRTRRDMQDQMKYASLRLMTELLESVDNLQRAIASYELEPNADGLAQGVAMVSTQISKVLEDHGCKKIDAVGQTFDPNLHQALQMQPSDDHPANTVMQDLRAGFQLHDRLIRPAQVFVSTGPAKGIDSYCQTFVLPTFEL